MDKRLTDLEKKVAALEGKAQEPQFIKHILIYNIVLLMLIGWSVWLLRSPLPMLGLLFIMTVKTTFKESE